MLPRSRKISYFRGIKGIANWFSLYCSWSQLVANSITKLINWKFRKIWLKSYCSRVLDKSPKVISQERISDHHVSSHSFAGRHKNTVYFKSKWINFSKWKPPFGDFNELENDMSIICKIEKSYFHDTYNSPCWSKYNFAGGHKKHRLFQAKMD